MRYLWEVLVPTVVNGKPVRTRQHREWDRRVRILSGGLTIYPPVKGQWVKQATDGAGELVEDRMIPVRIACTEAAIRTIGQMTAAFYQQDCVFIYRVSDCVLVLDRNGQDVGAPTAERVPVALRYGIETDLDPIEAR